MRKQIVAALLIAGLPLAALAQRTGAGQAAPGQGTAPGAQGPGGPGGPGPRMNPEFIEKRMRLARTLGLAEALDLDTSQALKLRETMARFDDRRLAVHKQLRDVADVLRRAAQGEKVAPAEVDQAIQRGLDARAQLQTIDREMVGAVTKDLTPEKKARAVLFLARFQHRFGPGMMHGRMGPWMQRGRGFRGGPGGMNGGGAGMGGGWGMGPGGPEMGMGPPADAWADDGP